MGEALEVKEAMRRFEGRAGGRIGSDLRAKEGGGHRETESICKVGERGPDIHKNTQRQRHTHTQRERERERERETGREGGRGGGERDSK